MSNECREKMPGVRVFVADWVANTATNALGLIERTRDS